MKNLIKRLLKVMRLLVVCPLYFVGWLLGVMVIYVGAIIFFISVAPVWYILTGKNTIDWWFDRLEDIGEWWGKITYKI